MRALVTGASRGIGWAIAERLLAADFAVEAVSRSGGGPSGAETRAVDLAGPYAQHALGDGPPLDVLVVNAGVCRTANLDAPDAAEVWAEVMRTNLDGAFHTLRGAYPRLREGSRVVAIASGLGRYGRAGKSAYAASKHGLLGLVRSLALEWAPRRITCNAICPGWVDTEMARADAPDRPATEGAIPLGRWVTPAEVADLAHWFTTPAAAIVTGQAYNIAGGEFSA